jgi:type VI secretion system protein ImpH
MAATSGGPSTSVSPATSGKEPGTTVSGSDQRLADGRRSEAAARLRTLEERLWEEPFAFDFFQAVRLLERLYPERKAVGRTGPPRAEVARFNAHLSLTFPPSSLYELHRPTEAVPVPVMIVAFMGLYGPSGVLPRHYTELLLRLNWESKGDEKHALRQWLDLFNHRFISLFYRAWEKYRFYIPYERGEYALSEPDAFTRSLFCLVGMGTPGLRNRLRVSTWEEVDGLVQEKPLARIDDLVLLYYGGLLAQRPRTAVGLEAILRDYFQLPVEVRQFQGHWLVLDEANQSRLGEGGGALGLNIVAGERVWDVQSKIRIRLGPLRYHQFAEFLPDRAPTPERKAFFMLMHWVRLYVGSELDFDVQLILQARDIPACQLAQTPDGGPHLGWNTWMCSQTPAQDSEDAVFEGEEIVFVHRPPPLHN